MSDKNSRHGVFLVRATLGFCFVMHGLQKILPNEWMGGQSFADSAAAMESHGVPAASVAGYLIPFVELLAGAALLVGFAHQAAAGAIVLLMAGAILYFHSSGYFAPRGMEYNLALIAMALLVFMAGPGTFAYKVNLKQNRPEKQ